MRVRLRGQRRARDVFASLLNHWGGHTPEFFARINRVPGRVGESFPEYSGDVKSTWQQWMTRGWFDWESDGYPYWSHLHHFKTWWAVRGHPNVLMVHFADLLADLAGEMRRVAAFLDVEVPEASMPAMVKRCTFEAVKADPERIVGDMHGSFKGGAHRFINAGTNGRWRTLLDDEDLALYARVLEAALPSDARRWLEHGTREPS